MVERMVPMAELPHERQVELAEQEAKTDAVYRERQAIAEFLRQYRRYLPEVTEEGRTRRLRLVDIADEVAARVEEAEQREPSADVVAADARVLHIREEALEELLPWTRIAGDALAGFVGDDDERAVQEIAVQDNALEAFLEALERLDRLEELGGDFRRDALESDAIPVRDHYRMRYHELGRVMQDIDAANSTIEHLQRVADRLRSNTRMVVHPHAISRQLRKIDEVVALRDALLASHPEAYLLERGRALAEAKATFDANGRIVETPYVRRKIVSIEGSIGRGRAIFIHGELGSGKSEIAKHVSRTRLSAPHLARWEAAHPAPKQEEAEAYTAWAAQRAEQAEALIIAGHRNLTAEQIVGTRGVQRAEQLTPEAQVQHIAERWSAFEREKRVEFLAAGLSDAETAARIGTMQPQFERAYQESFRAPVETRELLGPLLQAMREGRPLIIDEMNAIPHHTLIVMNDLLLLRPGDVVTPPIPGAAPFTVAEGFCVLATGNYKPEDGKFYIGRQPLDAAFLSRYDLLRYDYLPMSIEAEPPGLPPEEQRVYRQENELYQMLVAQLINTDLSLTLPEGELVRLHDLARVARMLQDVFSERDVPGFFAAVGGRSLAPKDVLKENVLSLRHLVPIVQAWKRDGFQRSLDSYLMRDYVSRSAARPAELVFLYQALQVQGNFFPQADGWPDGMSDRDALAFDIESEKASATGPHAPRGQRAPSLDRYSPKDVIEALYGPAPSRTEVPARYVDRSAVSAEEEDTQQEDEEARIAFERSLATLSQGFSAIHEESEGTAFKGEE
ncbi:MAG: hypothetical protein Q7S96_05155 [bacterium]|nr:hypothetical protein [bacterium]